MKRIMLNQKSGMSYSDIKTYVTDLKVYQNRFQIFPSSIYIEQFVSSGYNVGIQNIAELSAGNQTGEITASQAKSCGVKSTIIGHSERRINQKEDSNILINKFNEAINSKLNIIYCVGESLVDYKLKNTSSYIYSELNDVIGKVKIPKNIDLCIAYEPIWAIGSGLTPTNYEISEVTKLIDDYLNKNNIKADVLYGGSVNEKNIDELLKIENLDGFLIGGASNHSDKVIKICESVINSTK